MKLNKKHFSIFLLLLIIEVIIAVFIKQPFIRNVFGDFLAVIVLYSFFKSFLKVKSIYIALAVLFFSFFVEVLQLIDIISFLNIENRIIKIIIGTTFSYTDLIAYFSGIIAVLTIERLINLQFSN